MDNSFSQGKSVILIAYENVEDIPFQVGDKVKMTDTCIEENEYEQYDFPEIRCPKTENHLLCIRMTMVPWRI